jgi:hypothetical protein
MKYVSAEESSGLTCYAVRLGAYMDAAVLIRPPAPMACCLTLLIGTEGERAQSPVVPSICSRRSIRVATTILHIGRSPGRRFHSGTRLSRSDASDERHAPQDDGGTEGANTSVAAGTFGGLSSIS